MNTRAFSSVCVCIAILLGTVSATAQPLRIAVVQLSDIHRGSVGARLQPRQSTSDLTDLTDFTRFGKESVVLNFHFEPKSAEKVGAMVFNGEPLPRQIVIMDGFRRIVAGRVVGLSSLQTNKGVAMHGFVVAIDSRTDAERALDALGEDPNLVASRLLEDRRTWR